MGHGPVDQEENDKPLGGAMERPTASPVAGTSSTTPDVPGEEDRIDEEILDELFVIMGDGGSEGLVNAFDLFLSATPTRFEADLAQGRFADAAQGVHSLRGSAGAFGARRRAG